MTRPKSDDADSRRSRQGFELRAEEARVAKLEAEADMLGERVETEKENRTLRFGIGAWLGTTVVEVVAVVLVIVNYLFPNERREYA
jgi:hypothetical protein